MRALSAVSWFVLAIAPACAPPGPTKVDQPAPAATPIAEPAPREPGTIVVLAEGPGRGPLVVERELTGPLEQALAGVPGVTRVRSVSRTDAAEVVLSFASEAELDTALAAVQAQVNAARRSLPADVLTRISAGPGPRVLQFVVSGDDTALQLRAVAEPLRAALETTPGVARVELCGGREPVLQVTVDPARLTAYALPFAAISGALTEELRGGPPTPGVRFAARRPEDLAALVVKPGEAAVRLADVARVELAAMVPACDAARVGGGGVVIGTVVAQRGVVISTVTAELESRLAGRRAGLPAGAQLEVLTPTRMALEQLAGAAPKESVAVAARVLAPVLGSRAAYVRGVVPTNPGAPVELELLLERVDAAQSTALAQAIAALPGVRVRASDGDLEALTRVVVIGEELAVAARLARELAELARKQAGVRSAAARAVTLPELVIEVQRDRLAAFGLSEADLRLTLAGTLDGVTVGSISQDGAQVPVRVRLGESQVEQKALAASTIVTASGAVPLSELVTLRLAEQPDAILRIDRRRAIEVELQLDGAGARAAVERAAAAELRLPVGYALQFE